MGGTQDEDGCDLKGAPEGRTRGMRTDIRRGVGEATVNENAGVKFTAFYVELKKNNLVQKQFVRYQGNGLGTHF